MINKKTFGFKGKYCTSCNSVWEVLSASDSSGIEVKYPDFPSFGLEREQCSSCKEPSKSFKDLPSRLAARERHKELLQKTAMKHQELLNKHVKKHSK